MLRGDAGRPWTEADRARLREIAEEESARTEARGLTGRRLLWHRDRRVIFAHLDAFLDADERFRAGGIAETLATEFAFGMSEADAGTVDIRLGDGRFVRVRGKADRVDRRANGDLVVIDYKTGSERSFKSLSHDAPVTAGTHLQLPVYAYTARAAYGKPDTLVEAYYWFVGRGQNLTVGYDVDEAVDDVFTATIRTIVDGIEAGVFPAWPAEPKPTPFIECRYCDPDGMGTADRWREWENKFAAPELVGFHSARPARARRPRRDRRVTDQLAFFGALGDKPARDAIGTELDATLFVEAGAGTGKTKALVDRVVALVTSDGPDLPAPIQAIAAITFTEKAAAELRDRIRRELRASPTTSARLRSSARGAGSRSTISIPPRSARCTPSRSASSRSSRSRSVSRRASRCATRSRRGSRSKRAGASSSTRCSTTPSSSRRCSCSSPRV